MANPYLVLWCDPTKNKLYSGWQQNTEALIPILKQGDNIGVELHWVTRPVFGAVMDEVQFPPSCTVTLGLGRIDAIPSSGTFTITYNGESTQDLAHDITASELDTALNGLASITAEGGVSVTKNGSDFRIVWNDRVNYTNTFTCNVDALSPTSESQFVYVKDGSAYANRIVIFKLKQSIIAGTTSFTASPPPEITVVNLFSNVWRVTAYPTPKDGVFTLTFGGGISPAKVSSIISLADTSGDIQANLNNLNIGSFEVVTAGPYVWDITVPPAATVITAQNGLIGFSSLYGVLNMNTAEVEEFLSGAEQDTAVLEVQVDMGGEIQTLIQTNVTVINDLIQNSSFDVVDLGQVMPVDSVVRYDTSQALTSAEQLQARQNIDAISSSEVNVFSTDIATLQGQMVVVQGDIAAIESNFDQALLTTSNVQFNTVTVGTNTVVIDGSSISVSETVSSVTSTMLIESTGITFPDATVMTTANGVNPSLYLAKADNLSGIDDISIARTNLGLGTMAVATATDYLSKAGNLTGIADAATARSNLGLGLSSTVTHGSLLINGSTVSVNSTGFTFADGTTQTTAATGGGGFTPPTPTSNDNDVIVYNQSSSSWTNSSDVNRVALITTQSGSNAGNQVIASGWNSTTFLPSIQVSDGIGNTAYYQSTGIRFPDGTTQTTAASGGGNPFNQDLNTIDSPMFGETTLGANNGVRVGSQYGGIGVYYEFGGGGSPDKMSIVNGAITVGDYADSGIAKVEYDAGSTSGKLTLRNGATSSTVTITPESITFPDGSVQNTKATALIDVTDGLKYTWSQDVQGNTSADLTGPFRQAIAFAQNPTTPPDDPATASKCMCGGLFYADGIGTTEMFTTIAMNRPWIATLKCNVTGGGTHLYTSGEPWSVSVGLFEFDAVNNEPTNSLFEFKYFHDFANGTQRCNLNVTANAAQIQGVPTYGAQRAYYKIVYSPTGCKFTLYGSDPVTGPPEQLIGIAYGAPYSASLLRFGLFAKIEPNLSAILPPTPSPSVSIRVCDFNFAYLD